MVETLGDTVWEATDRANSSAAPDLARRLTVAEGALAVFVFKRAYDLATDSLAARGWTVARMPGPYEPRANAADRMRRLAEQIGRISR